MSKGRQPGYWRRYRAPPWWFRLGDEEAPQTHEKTTQTLMLAFKVIVVGTVAYLLLGALWGIWDEAEANACAIEHWGE